MLFVTFFYISGKLMYYIYLKIMRFAGFLHVQIHSWNANVSWTLQSTSSRQGTAWYLLGCFSPWWSGLQGSWNVGIPRMDLDTEETRETHNLYIERTRGSLKSIISIIKYWLYFWEANFNWQRYIFSLN